MTQRERTARRGTMGRREFLLRAGQGAAVVGTAMAAAEARMPVEPCDPHAPKTGRLLDADEVIGLGLIGVGGMGMSHLKDFVNREKQGHPVQVRAVSDVFVRRQQGAQAIVRGNLNREIEAYLDYTKLLARDDIHAVVIATPDHWHALTSIHAMEAGKDVYCQKPLTLTIEESLAVRDTALKTGRIFQCGAQGSSDDKWWQARKIIKEGGIGKVLWAHASANRNSRGGPDDRGGEWNYLIHRDATNDPAAGDAYIDWDQWLGPAPKRPFNKARFFQFRKYWDYSGGIATDLFYHVLAPLTIALDAKTPERATANGGIFVQHDDREVPDTYMATLDYPDDYTVVLTSSMANSQSMPVMICGHRATIRPDGDTLKVTAEREFEEWFSERYGAAELVIPPAPRAEHMTNWLECIRSREKPHLDAETACRTMVGIRMGVDAYRQDKVVYWDHEKECYADSHPRPERKSFWPSEPEQA